MIRLGLVLGAFLVGGALASPAGDFLAEVKRHLRTYNGPIAVDAGTLQRQAETELAERCAAVQACPLTIGREVAEKLVDAYQDKHTNLKPPAVARRVRAELRGEMLSRVGLRVIPAGEEGLVVGFVRPGSPAARAGLRGGELITHVNGESATGARLAAAEDTGVVRLRLTGRELTLTAESMPARDAPSLRVVQDVNVVNIPSFLGEGVARSFFQTLAGLGQVSSLIVDLRANGGGTVNECLLAASAFGTARHELQGQRYRVEYTATYGKLFANGRQHAELAPVRTLPVERVLVLVGERTASCAEIFASALQEMGAKVVGAPTAGVRNSAVDLIDLSDGSLLSVTTSRALDRHGRPITATVQPDVLVPLDYELLRGGTDPVLERALRLAAPPVVTR